MCFSKCFVFLAYACKQLFHPAFVLDFRDKDDKDEDDDDCKDGRDGSERPCLAPPILAAYCDENEGDDYEGGDNNGMMM